MVMATVLMSMLKRVIIGEFVDRDTFVEANRALINDYRVFQNLNVAMFMPTMHLSMPTLCEYTVDTSIV